MICPEGTTTHGGPILEQVYLEELQPVEDPHWSKEKFEKKGVAVRNYQRLTKPPILHAFHATRGRKEVEELGKTE